jgi:hypothetical protein
VDTGEKFLRSGRVGGEGANDIFRPWHSQLKDKMIIGGLHVVSDRGSAKNLNHLADGPRIAAAPDQLDALFALPFIERPSTQFLRDQLDAANRAARVRLRIFRVAEWAIPHGLETLHG